MYEAFYEHMEEYLAAYMFLGLAFVLFTGLPVAVAIGGIAFVFGLFGMYFEFFEFQEFFNVVSRTWGGDGQSGAVHNPILVAIPLFVFMGTMLERSQVAANLLEILQVLLRRVPGGLALAVTLMGTIMAATTGIIGASVVMMTLLALKTMLDARYSESLATGTIAASATLGILIPPSIMLVLMANLMAVSVGNLFMGAFFPGLVLASLYFIYILTLATLRPKMAPRPEVQDDIDPTKWSHVFLFIGGTIASLYAAIYLDRVLIDSAALGWIWWFLCWFIGFTFASMVVGRSQPNTLFGMVLRGFVPPVALIVFVLGSIFSGTATPTEAAGVGGIAAILLSWFNKTLTRDVIRDVCLRTSLTTGMIFFIFIGATAFAAIFRALFGEFLIEDFINGLGLGSWQLLFLLLIIVFFLGFFLDFLEITLIILPVFGPIVAAQSFPALFGAEGMHVEGRDVMYWFLILMAVNLQTSFLTPPFGFALFYMKGVAGKLVSMSAIYKGIIPFVILQLIGLGFAIVFPWLSLWLPSVVLD